MEAVTPDAPAREVARCRAGGASGWSPGARSSSVAAAAGSSSACCSRPRIVVGSFLVPALLFGDEQAREGRRRATAATGPEGTVQAIASGADRPLVLSPTRTEPRPRPRSRRARSRSVVDVPADLSGPGEIRLQGGAPTSSSRAIVGAAVVGAPGGRRADESRCRSGRAGGRAAPPRRSGARSADRRRSGQASWSRTSGPS